MEKITALIMISLVAESVWESLKMLWQDGKLSVDRLGALITSVIICIGIKLDLLALLGIDNSIPYLGIMLSGVLISRGSNFMHDLLVRVGNVKNNK